MGDSVDDLGALRRVLHRVRAVLLDFDGPVTDLFGDTSTAPIAAEIKEAVHAVWGPLDPDVEACEDSHGILKLLRDMYDRPSPTPRSHRALELAEDIVTQHEYVAVKSAARAPHVTGLVGALGARGLPVVIVSNNAEGPVEAFLKEHGLQPDIAGVVGRDPRELRRMKPAPHSVRRAAGLLRVKPEQCLLVGDQLTDLTAARAAGTLFLGYTSFEERAAEMLRRGADAVVSSHLPLIEAVSAD